jgi:gluconolactonase
MRPVLVAVAWLAAAILQPGVARAQGAPAPAPAPLPVCRPAVAVVPAAIARPATGTPATSAPGERGRGAAQPVPRPVTITGIPGVVAGGVTWTKVWQGGGNSADGILTHPDGSALVAQEDFDTVLKIAPSGTTSVFVTGAKGIGSLSMDRQGRLYGAHRTERPGSTKPDRDTIVNAITVLAPERKTVATTWSDRTVLTVRPNDLAADGTGGAYFTSGCLYYASPAGGVTVVAENLRTNGIVLSLDDKALYVTNGGGGQTPGTIVAFDVAGPGRLANRRDFATLSAGAGDGLALDAEGRLYVTSNAGVQVFDRTGAPLGLIPTPRGVISAAFAGPDKKTLFIVGSGAETANGAPIHEGPQQTAATVYTLPMLARGLPGRAK